MHLRRNRQRGVTTTTADPSAEAAMIANYVENTSSGDNDDVPSFDDSSSVSSVEEATAAATSPALVVPTERVSRVQYELPRKTPRASTSAIMSLTHIRVLPHDKVTYKNDDRCCSICSEPLVDGVVLTRLPCGHLYHISCVVPWLNRSCTCPDCRYELPSDDRKFEAGRAERMKDRKIVSCHCSRFDYHSCIFVEGPQD